MRRLARRDTHEQAIVSALERIGVVVIRVSSPGVPDLLTWRQDRGWLPIEIKRPGEHLTPAQLALRERACFPVVRSVDEALELYGVKA
jgi:hypothetical protein